VIAVLDVSGAIQILLRKQKAPMFKEALETSDAILSPDLFVPELANTLWKYCRAKELTAEKCHQYMDEGINLVDQFIDSKEIWQEAFDEGIKNKHPVYDMCYAVTARRNGAVLVTNDGDLAKICKKQKIGIYF
jgi:predicted nucleic acid-binding protein